MITVSAASLTVRSQPSYFPVLNTLTVAILRSREPAQVKYSHCNIRCQTSERHVYPTMETGTSRFWVFVRARARTVIIARNYNIHVHVCYSCDGSSRALESYYGSLLCLLKTILSVNYWLSRTMLKLTGLCRRDDLLHTTAKLFQHCLLYLVH